MKRVALAALLVLVASTGAFARASNTGFEQQTAADADSLGAAADTSEVKKIPLEAAGFFTTVWCDTIATYTTQVSPDYGSAGAVAKWMAVDFDTTAAGVPESTADFGKAFAGWWTRVILDSRAAATKFRGNGYLHWND